MTKRFLRFFVISLAFTAAWPVALHAQLVIDITEGREGALPIAVIPFSWQGRAAQAPEGIGEIIAADLVRSGRFQPLNMARLPSRPREKEEIRWQDWKRLGMRSIVVGKIRQDGAAGGAAALYTVEFGLYDVLTQQRLADGRDQVRASNLRKAAHQLSDIIYQALLGERGAFDTQIAYVTETSDLSGTRHYAMNVSDSDGFNEFAIYRSQHPMMSPAWSHDAKRLAYVSFDNNRAAVYVHDLASGTRKRVSSYRGINGAPAWSPDDSRLALTLSKDGNPEIYVLHLASGVLRRVTENAAIDTEPAWSPDGRRLVFTSDRGGSPQIYSVSVNGGRPERLSFQGTYNARPTFAPDGKSLAIVHGNEGRYRIGLLDLAAGANGIVNVLTDGSLDESPTLSPNGQMVLYATTASGRATLAAVSLDGGFQARIGSGEGGVRDPAWSPFLN